MESVNPLVRAVNTLTAQWCRHLDGGDAAVSGAGVWPLLALLASAGDEAAQAELSAALGRPASTAQRDAVELVELLRHADSTSAALGIWARRDTPLHRDWAAGLPEGLVGSLSGQEELDRWVAEQTGGLIDRFPALDGDIHLVLASVVTARTQWCIPFDSEPLHPGASRNDTGPQLLDRTTHDLSEVALLDGAVSRVVVEGDDDLDVHLLIGDGEPAEVLAAGLRELSGDAAVRPAAELVGVDAPGLTVRRELSSFEDDRLRLRLPSFDIDTHHDLLAHGDLFGLRTVTDPGTSHLPLLSPVPLYVSQAEQDLVVHFTANGFEAAALTEARMSCTGALMPDKYEITSVDARFDRPFGFLAVHRPSRLALFAGWVASPFS